MTSSPVRPPQDENPPAQDANSQESVQAGIQASLCEAPSGGREQAFAGAGARLVLACAAGDLQATLEGIKYSKAMGRNPGHTEVRQAIDACAKGADPQATCLRALVEAGFSDPRGEALSQAAMFGAMEALEILLPLGRAKSQSCLALRCACQSGRARAVARLLPLSDPSVNGWEALGGAAASGSAPTLRQILSANPPQAAIDEALGRAACANSGECCLELAALASEGALLQALAAAQGDLLSRAACAGPRLIKTLAMARHEPWHQAQQAIEAEIARRELAGEAGAGSPSKRQPL